MKFLFIYAFAVIGINAKCCYKTSVNYVAKKGACGDYEDGNVVQSNWRSRDPYSIGALADTLRSYCVANVCADGRYHLHCTTKGECNIFSCECEGDCIKGDAVKQFSENHKGNVDGVAKSYSTYGTIIGLATYIYDAFTKNEPCCMNIYENGKWKGEKMEICAKCGECINLPKEWQNRISSYGALKTATFYTEENCQGHHEEACRDFSYTGFLAGINNLWGLICSNDNINDKTKSVKMH